MCTYQVNIRHKVSKKGSWDSKSPNPITRNFENGKIENLFCRRKFELALLSTLCVFGMGNERLVSEASEEQNKHEDAQNP